MDITEDHTSRIPDDKSTMASTMVSTSPVTDSKSLGPLSTQAHHVSDASLDRYDVATVERVYRYVWAKNSTQYNFLDTDLP